CWSSCSPPRSPGEVPHVLDPAAAVPVPERRPERPSAGRLDRLEGAADEPGAALAPGGGGPREEGGPHPRPPPVAVHPPPALPLPLHQGGHLRLPGPQWGPVLARQ